MSSLFFFRLVHDEAQASSIRALTDVLGSIPADHKDSFRKNVSAFLSKLLGDLGLSDPPENGSVRIRKVGGVLFKYLIFLSF